MTQGDDIEPEEHDPIDVEPDLVIPVTFMSEFGSHTIDEPCPAEGKGWCPCQERDESEADATAHTSPTQIP